MSLRTTTQFPDRQPEAPESPQFSSKNYALSVVLCAVFGTLGIHFFYIGRYLHGLVDLGMLTAAIILFVQGHEVLAVVIFLLDLLHSMIMSYRLLTGQCRDGKGLKIAYPGQKA